MIKTESNTPKKTNNKLQKAKKEIIMQYNGRKKIKYYSGTLINDLCGMTILETVLMCNVIPMAVNHFFEGSVPSFLSNSMKNEARNPANSFAGGIA